MAKRRTKPSRPKLDPKLSYALSLPIKKLAQLKAEETQRLKEISDTSVQGTEKGKPGAFAAIFHGIEFPQSKEKGIRHPLKKPYCSAFIKFLGSRKDLEQLGIKVRSQPGIFLLYSFLWQSYHDWKS
jgi:hypothetical protein